MWYNVKIFDKFEILFICITRLEIVKKGIYLHIYVLIYDEMINFWFYKRKKLYSKIYYQTFIWSILSSKNLERSVELNFPYYIILQYDAI